MVVINQLLVSPINMNKNNQRNATEFDGLFFFFFIVMMELYIHILFIEVTIVNDNSSHQSSYL
ncbi:hypothetical protein MGC_02692 [Candida albicans P37039]|nr:hypothetical protein MGC_02692 [Candida albicans P37039]